MGLDEFIDRHIVKTGNAGIALHTEDSMILFDPFFTDANEISFQNYLLENSDAEHKAAFFTHLHYDHGFRPRELKFLFENGFQVNIAEDIQNLHAKRWWSKRSGELSSLLDKYAENITVADQMNNAIGDTLIKTFDSSHAHVNLVRYLRPLSKLPRRISGFIEHKMHPSRKTVGYEIDIGAVKMVHLGSQALGEYVPVDVDVLFLPLSEGPNPKNPNPAYDSERHIINSIKPVRIVPIHDDGIDGILMQYDAEDFATQFGGVKLLNPVYRVPGLMPKEICCKNWVHLFDYIENTTNFPSGKKGREAIDSLLKGLVNNPNFLIQDPNDPDTISIVREKHLTDEKYWHSNVFNLKFFSNAAEVIGGYEPLFRAGKVSTYISVHEKCPKHFQLPRLWDMSKMFKKVGRRNRTFNRTKNPVSLKFEQGHGEVALQYYRKYRTAISHHVCDWNRGVYTGLGKFTASRDIQVRENKCLTKGDDDCTFILDWTHRHKGKQWFRFIYSIFAPDDVYRDDMDNMFLTDLIMRQEGIIRDREKKLKHAQDQIVQQKTMSAIGILASGTAHNFKNVLSVIQDSTSNIIDYAISNFYSPSTFSQHGISEDDRNWLIDFIEKRFFTDKQIGFINGLEALKRSSSIENLLTEYDISLKAKSLGQLSSIDISMDDIKSLLPYMKKYGVDKLCSVLDFGYQIGSQSQNIHRSLATANNIISNIMTSTHLSKLNDDPVDIGNLLVKLFQEYETINKDNRVEMILYNEKLPPVLIDERIIRTLYETLYENSIDAMKGTEQERKIEVKLYRDNRKVCMDFSDNGEGISQENMDKVFQPFFTTKNQIGTGMGLYIIYTIMKNYGNISVQSMPGRTTFTIGIDEKFVLWKDLYTNNHLRVTK